MKPKYQQLDNTKALIHDMREMAVDFAREKNIPLFNCYECDKPMIEEKDFCSEECEKAFARTNPLVIHQCDCGQTVLGQRFCSDKCAEMKTFNIQ